MRPINVVFDLDGTLADCSHRVHHILHKPKDWRAFFAACGTDVPIEPLVTLCRNMCEDYEKYRVEIWSGRSDEVRDETREWLGKHVGWGWAKLRMRKAGDHRTDELVKAEFLTYGSPDIIFDDRSRVVDMWRSHGIVTCQVAPGDF